MWQEGHTGRAPRGEELYENVVTVLQHLVKLCPCHGLDRGVLVPVAARLVLALQTLDKLVTARPEGQNFPIMAPGRGDTRHFT